MTKIKEREFVFSSQFFAEKVKYCVCWKAPASSYLCVSDITDVTLVDQEAEVCGENGFLAGYKEVEYEVVGYEVKGAFGWDELGGGDVG